MKLIVCVDDNYGILFNNRRVSRDKAVILKISELINSNEILVSEYSSELFSDTSVNLKIVKGIFKRTDGSYIFCEEEIPPKYFNKITEIYLFKWNRKYPSDVKFPFVDLCEKAELSATEKLVGNSHPEITFEVYKL